MTKTALEMEAIKSKEKIADKDRNVKKGELALKEKQFKHDRVMDWVSTFVPRGKYTIPVKATPAKGKNDPAWYKRYLTDLDKFTNVSTYNRLGIQNFHGLFGCKGQIETGEFVSSSNFRLPGLAICHWLPTIGSGPDAAATISTSPINQILMRTKEQVLKSNSRSNLNYDAGDIGYNFLATGSILIAISEFERMLLVAQTYKADNAYFAEAALKALGANPTKWLDNLPDARKYLTILKHRFNSAIVAPKDLSLYEKYLYLGGSWFKDSEAEPHQVYAYVVDYLYQLANDAKTVDAFSTSAMKESPATMYAKISAMIQALAEDPSFIEMFADLRSAFGDNLLQINPNVDETAEIEAAYNTMGIEQIGNVRTLPMVYEPEGSGEAIRPTFNLSDLKIKQDNSGYIYQGPTTAIPYIPVSYVSEISGSVLNSAMKAAVSLDRTVNMHKDQITGDDILDVTRWFYDLSDIGYANNTVTGYLKSCDTAVAIKWVIYAYYQAGTTLTLEPFEVSTNVVISSDGSTPDYPTAHFMLQTLAACYEFDWFPAVRIGLVEHHGSSDIRFFVYGFCEAEHAFDLDMDTIRHLHTACVLSEFYINTTMFKR